MDCGHDLDACLSIIAASRTQKRIAALRSELSSGSPLGDHLIDIPNLNLHFQFFLQYCEVAQALHQSIAMYEYEKTLKDQFWQAIAYPLFIFAVSMSCIAVMVGYVLPMMIQLMEAMGLTGHVLLRNASAGLLLFLGAAVVLVILASCLWIYCFTKEKQLACFMWCNRYAPEHPFKFFHSMIFAGYWLACKGQSTLDAISFLKQMRHRPLSMECALRIDEALLSGVSLPDAIRESQMLSSNLCLCFEIGSRTQQLEDYLHAFITRSKQQLERYQKRFVRIMQIVAYGSVAVIVLIITQVLFAPLDLLAQL